MAGSSSRATCGEIRVDQGSLDLWGFITLDVTGFYRSNGAFLIDAHAGIAWNGSWTRANATIQLSLGQDAAGYRTFLGDVYASTQVSLLDWWGNWYWANGPAARAKMTFGPRNVSFALKARALGRWWYFIDINWQRRNTTGSERPTPVLARQQGSVLTLSAGDAPERYGDTNGEWYGSILNETFSIEAIRGAGGNPLPGRVRVKSLGFEQDFSGVTRIIANGGDGNDTFEVGPDVQAELVFDGGLGSDSFVVESPVGASRFTGGIGRGYDRLKVNGQFANFTLADSGLNLLLTPNGAPSNQARLSDIDTVYFVDQSVGANAPTGTRASSGPTVNGDIHLALRTYDNEELVTNLDLIRDDSEPYTRTNSQGEFYFDDGMLNDADRNSDGVTDWRDGMLVVGSPTNKDGGTTLSVTDSITGIKCRISTCRPAREQCDRAHDTQVCRAPSLATWAECGRRGRDP